MNKQQKAAIDLLYFAAKNQWQASIDDKPFCNMIDALYNNPIHTTQGLHIIYRAIDRHLQMLSMNNKMSFDQTDADNMIDTIRRTLQINTIQYWIVIPLRDATLSITVRTRNFIFISGSREEKIKLLQQLTKVSEEQMLFRAQHLETSRSPGFFEHPLLAVQVDDLHEHISGLADVYAIGATMLLQLLHWCYVGKPTSSLRLRKAGGEPICEHIAYYNREDSNWGHNVLRYSTRCHFSLDWISKPEAKKKFGDFFDCITISNNDLARRFFRALRFFCKAVQSMNTNEPYDGLGLAFLYSMIAAETLILENDGEKRSRIMLLLPILARQKMYSRSECVKAIDNAYKLRSDFVHAGNDTYPDNSFLTPDEGKVVKDIRITLHLLANLLLNGPKYIKQVSRQCDQNSTKYSEVWFGYLRSVWNKALGIK